MNPRPHHTASGPPEGEGHPPPHAGCDPAPPCNPALPASSGALSRLQVPSPTLPGGSRGGGPPHPSLRCAPALVPYLAEVSSLELLHLGGWVSGASRLGFP